MSKFRPSSVIMLMIALLLLPAFTIPATAQGNPTKTPKPTNTVRPSVTPKPSITPVGFVPIAARADDFGGGGTILYSMDSNDAWVMDASGKNDRVALAAEKGGLRFANASFLGDANTILFVSSGDVYLTDLKGRKPEKLPGAEGAGYYALSPDRTQFVFRVAADSGESSLVAYDVAAKQRRELAKTAAGKYFALLGWIDEGKQYVAGEFDSPRNPLTDVKVYNVVDGSSSPLTVAGLRRSFVRSPAGKFAFCGTGSIGLLDMTDGKQTELLALPAGEECLVQLAWSPDGKYMIFGSGKPSYDSGTEPFKIQVVNVETKEVTLIKKSNEKGTPSKLTGLDWIAAAP